ILSIQVVARAAQAEIEITPQQIFECQTIARLAKAAAESNNIIVARQQSVVGEVALTPIQQWYFAAPQAVTEQNNQTVLLQVDSEVISSLLNQVITELVKHHDVLRMGYEWNNGSWRQVCEASRSIDVITVDHSNIILSARNAELNRVAEQLQSS